MPKKQHWLDVVKNGAVPSTRERSKKQETRIAKDLKGYATINSGATFGENDVVNDFCEVEAKTTGKLKYTLSLAEWNKLQKRTKAEKIPIMVIDFETEDKNFAVLKYADFLYLINKANQEQNT